jgi:hypothetical protein
MQYSAQTRTHLQSTEQLAHGAMQARLQLFSVLHGVLQANPTQRGLAALARRRPCAAAKAGSS